MNYRVATLVCIAVASFCCMPALAQSPGTDRPAYGSRYVDVKIWFARRAVMNPSQDARVDALRDVVRARYGNRGLESIFENFSGRQSIDPQIPGVVKNILLTASDNPNVAKGARRTQLYANRLHNDPRFTLLALDEPTQTRLGRTDKDIRYRHDASGTAGRIEVKDWKVSSQVSNIEKIKLQIRKMALSHQETGELQSLVNRHKLIPEIRDYARRFNVPTYESVVTGEKSLRKPGTIPIDDVYDHLDRRAVAHSRVSLVRGGASLGFGLLTAIQSGRSAFREYQHQQLLVGTSQNWRRFGRHASMTGFGTALVAGGSSELASMALSGRSVAGRLATFGKVGGGAAVVFFLVAEGFLVAEYAAGDVSTREFILSQSALGGGVAGGVAGALVGAKAGAALGVWFGPWVAAIGGIGGAIAGGFGGGYAGSASASFAAEKYYDFKDTQHERQFRQFIFTHYGVNAKPARRK